MRRTARIMMAVTALVGVNAVGIARARKVRNDRDSDDAWREKFDCERYSGRYNH